MSGSPSTQPAEDPILGLLLANDKAQRRVGIRRFRQCGLPRQRLLFQAWIADDRPEYRRSALLNVEGKAEFLPLVAERLRSDPHPHVRLTAALNLSRASQRDALVAGLDDADDRISRICCIGLGHIGDKAIAPAIESLLSRPEWDVRWRAASALVVLEAVSDKVIEAIEQLSREAEATDWNTRRLYERAELPDEFSEPTTDELLAKALSQKERD
jgi:HEAT repeat protein